jgi:chromosome segregation ATPase
MTLLPIALLLGLAPAAALPPSPVTPSNDSTAYLASIDRSLQHLAALADRMDQRQRVDLLLRRAELSASESSPYVAEARSVRSAKEAVDETIHSSEAQLREMHQMVDSGKLGGRELDAAELELAHAEETLNEARTQSKRFTERLAGLEADLAHFAAEREQLKGLIDRLLAALDAGP